MVSLDVFAAEKGLTCGGAVSQVVPWSPVGMIASCFRGGASVRQSLTGVPMDALMFDFGTDLRRRLAFSTISYGSLVVGEE